MGNFKVWFERRSFMIIEDADSAMEAEGFALNDLYCGAPMTGEGDYEMIDETEEVAEDSEDLLL